MSQDPAPLRSTAVWVVATGCAAAVARAAIPALGDLPGTRHDFSALLGVAAAAVALVAAGWLWWCTTSLVLGAVRGIATRPRGCPEAWRRAVLAACGIGLAGVLAAPAQAGDRPLERSHAALDVREIAALPLPDRASGSLPQRPTSRGPEVVVVRAGDSLWALAAARLPADAPDTAVAAYARRVHLRNRAVIGDDPDLIRPGQRLVLPSAAIPLGEDER